MRIIPPPMPKSRNKDYWPNKKDRKAFLKIQRKIKKAIKNATSSLNL